MVFQAPMDGLAYPILFVDEGKFIPTNIWSTHTTSTNLIIAWKVLWGLGGSKASVRTCQAKSCKTSFPPRFFFQKIEAFKLFFFPPFGGKMQLMPEVLF